MKSSITFFDTFQNSEKGTMRGISIFPLFIVLNIMFYLCTKKIYDYNRSTRVKIFSLFLIGLIIVSALGVQTSDSMHKALVYGALIGFIVYGVAISTQFSLNNNKNWTFKQVSVYLIWGVLSTSMLSGLLYIIVNSDFNLLYV